MKTKLIVLPEHNIIVSDEEIKQGWKGYAYKNDVVGNTFKHFYTTNEWYNDAKIVVAGIPELPSIDYSQLSEDDCKKIGYVDVEKLAEQKYPTIGNVFDFMRLKQNVPYNIGFIEGFKEAQSLNIQKYSENDLRRAMHYAFENGNSNPSRGYLLQEYIDRLNQPKIFDIEVEMEEKEVYSNENKDGLLPHRFSYYQGKFNIPKITNNSIKITQIL